MGRSSSASWPVASRPGSGAMASCRPRPWGSASQRVPHLAPVPAQRLEGVLEHVVPDEPPVRDTFGLVERPVDAEVDPALAILLLGLGERREAAPEAQAHVSVVV